ncbi:MAG: type II CAAX endopeptidase family protein [Planctomycetota bacterium]
MSQPNPHEASEPDEHPDERAGKRPEVEVPPSETLASDPIDRDTSPISPPLKARLWPLPVVLIASLVVFFVGSFVSIVIAYAVVNGKIDMGLANRKAMESIMSSRIGFLITVIVPQIALMSPAIFAALISPVAFRKRLSLVRGQWPLWAWVAAAFATPLIGWVSSALVSAFLDDSENLQALSGAFRQLGEGGFLIPLALAIGMTPALCEEILFRGYVQTRLNRRIGPLFGILLSSFVFAAFHLDPVHCIGVFPIGVFLGLIAWRSGSLFPAMLAHFVNNAVGVIAVVLAPASIDDPVSAEMVLFILIMLVLGMAGGSVAVFAMLYFKPANETVNP